MKNVLICISLILIGIAVLLTSCQNAAITGAKSYMADRNYDKAIEECQLAITQDPSNAEAYYIMGQAYGRKRMYPEMLEAFNKCLEINQKFAADIDQHKTKYWVEIFNDGVAAIKQNQLQEAIDDFHIAKQLIPSRTDAHKNMSFTYGQMGEYDKAIEINKEALEIDPYDMELKNNLGALYYQTKQYDKAIEILSEVLDEADPTSEMYADALYNTAISYDLMGAPDKAIAAYATALETLPDDRSLLFNLARLYYMRDDYENAAIYFQKVIDIDPENFAAYMNLGSTYLLSEKYSEAIPLFEKATELNPENAKAWNNLGVAYVRSGKAEEGKAAFDKATELENK